jgi:hypothetical protein
MADNIKGVPMRTWNKRAVQGALIRLDQSGMIKRFRVRKKRTEDSWVICIQVQREPRAEDLENLGFRRQAAIADTTDELLQDDVDGDALMRDLEVDMLDDNGENENKNDLNEDVRIPPQWTPDRLLANIIMDFTELGQEFGWDSVVLRDRVVGPFWRRPMESYLTRLTDDWARMQPPHLRHLAIIRDTRNTEEKKFLHYVYRTYGYFQQAVIAGEALWEGVSRPAAKPEGKSSQWKKHANETSSLDLWGFHSLNQKDFVRFNGTATLSDVRSAIVNPRKYGPRWDNALAEEIGYQKLETPVTKTKAQRHLKQVLVRDSLNPDVPGDDEDTDEHDETMPVSSKRKTGKAKKKGSGLTLTPEQRIALGLKSTGRLSKSVANQILAHRRETGDPTSMPDSITEEPVVVRGRAPLMTKEERLAENLPLRGRLGLDKENEIREKRGMPKLLEKTRKKRVSKEAAILTKQQRIALGLKGHGRLHQHFVDALRREQEEEIPLSESPAVEAYREFLRTGTTKAAARKVNSTTSGHNTPAPERHSLATAEVEQEARPDTSLSPSPISGAGKRRGNDLNVLLPASKKSRILSGPLPDERIASSLPQPLELVNNSTSPFALLNTSPNDPLGNGIVISDDESHQPLQKIRQDPKAASIERDPTQSAIFVLSSKDNKNSDDHAARTFPGLYIYLYAKRKVTRGRPRNACIAVFRTTRLSELPWFKTEPSSGYDSCQISSMGAAKPPREGSGQFADASVHTSTSINALASLQQSPAPQAEAASDSGEVADSNCEAPFISARQHDEEPSLQVESERRELQQPAASDIETQVRTTEVPLHLPENSDSETQEGRVVVALQQPFAAATDTGSATLDRGLYTKAGWNMINASAQVTQPSYQSPYAPRPHSDSAAPVQQAAVTNGRKLPTIRLEAHNPEMSTSTPMPQGVVGPIAEIDQTNTTAQKKTSARSAAPGITGSALKFRREIIQEIIDRCGGVFPLHGEIWRPFSAMWDQRHGHTSIPKPGSSTVSDTLKNMISSPAFNLKRMAFLVKARNATGTKERVMVTRSDMVPSDRKVMQLAYNMANNALDKSHQYYPEGIRDVFEYETLYVPLPVAPKDETLFLDQIYPELLESSIKENKDRRRREKAAQKKREKEAAKEQNEQVEKVIPKRQALAQQSQSSPRTKRTRLASLNDKNKRYRRAPAQVPAIEPVEEISSEAGVREPSPTDPGSIDNAPLMTLRPWVTSEIVDCGADDEEASPSDVEEDYEEAVGKYDTSILNLSTVSFMDPVVRFDPITGTFSTSFSLVVPSGNVLSGVTSKTNDESTSTLKVRKRVRIDESLAERPSKRARSGTVSQQETLDDEFVYSSIGDSDATSSEDEDEEVRPKQKQKRKKRIASKRQRGKNLPAPTLLERLTGLTGDPNDPIYTDPKLRQRTSSLRPWAERKKKQLNKMRKEREYAENLDHVDKFKKLCLTLILASCMSGKDGNVNWSIVGKVYARDNFFNIFKAKKLWTWMQIHMAIQLEELNNTLQTNLLTAYDAGRLPTIHDPDVYDWAGLVRWTMRTCEYPEIPLPVYQEALNQFVVEESGYVALDRVNWYGKKLADTVRTQLQLQLPFVAPLHELHGQSSPVEDKELKARSWIRANTATPQTIYDANRAHEKLRVLGEDVLTRVVGDFVQQEHLKMRKLKRQLPGRNYTFTKKFAKTYKRPFELEDFMIAATVKKELDTAFANEDPEKRIYSISRCEEDGSIMVLMSLVGDGKVRFMPQLPPVNNEFGAPLPRLSKWGFCEGDYIHRAIDRNRLFWDIHVVPTSDYQFGNPLQPSQSPSADWPSLPNPPLPGIYNTDALLPIWSSIDGQSVTWPWWYRILNLVLQPLFWQPGATATDIHSHCLEHTTDVFEIKLVLDWLGSIGAVSKKLGGGYQLTPNFWAAFGDRLHDTEDDWFGEHVKRNTKMTTKQQWRDKYNLRYSAMQTHSMRGVGAAIREREQPGSEAQEAGDAVSQQIAQNSKAQYRILQQVLLEPALGSQTEAVAISQIEQSAVTQEEQMGDVHDNAKQSLAPLFVEQDRTTSVPHQPGRDIETVDVDADADAEGEDVDAEGEMDDAMY